MKNYLTLILLETMIISSYSQKPENVKISDLQTACDYLNAIEIVIDTVINIGGNRLWEEITQKDKDYLKVLFAKSKEIGEAVTKKHIAAELENCPNFIRYLDKLKKLTNEEPIERSGRSDLEKKVETYIIEDIKPIYYHSIGFDEKKVFDLEQLTKDYKVPSIFSDEPKAFKENEEAFEWLKSISKEVIIGYSITLTFGLKEKWADAWSSYWVIVLLDNDLDIIGHFYYSP